jgi:N-acetylglucosaminyldiphosphoundecaprenol N-acetyl-beta-D-mannosaminyltransferase
MDEAPWFTADSELIEKMTKDRVDILGLHFDNFDKAEALRKIEEFIENKTPTKIFTPNVALLVWARSDSLLKNVYENCDIVTVDGMAIYYASHILGTPLKESLSASLLFFPLLEICQDKGYGVYLVGAQDDVVNDAAKKLREKYPDLRILGWHHGYFDMEDPPGELIEDIQNKRPDVLFVGMSTPHKERFVDSNIERMNVPVSLGVGGMFDIAAGRAHFAPEWIRKLCLEWLYRLLQEPRRMWRRYLTTNSIFLWLLFRELVRRGLGKIFK